MTLLFSWRIEGGGHFLKGVLLIFFFKGSYSATQIWQYLLLNGIGWTFYFAILVSHLTNL